MEEILSQLMDLLLPAIFAAATFVLAKAAQLIKNKVNESKTNIDNTLAAIAVRWVEDFAKSEKGEEKTRMAVERLVDMARKRGSKIDEDDAYRYIRSAYTATIKPLKEIQAGK